MPFTSTKISMSAAFAGMLVDNSPNRTESFINVGSASLPFGTMVAKDTSADNAAKLFASNADAPVGVLRHQQAYAKPYDLDTIGVTQYRSLGVLVFGSIYVVVSEAVTPASPVRVFCDTTAGANGATNGPGCFCTTSSAGHTKLLSKSANFLATTTGAGIVALRVDMTGAVASATND